MLILPVPATFRETAGAGKIGIFLRCLLEPPECSHSLVKLLANDDDVKIANHNNAAVRKIRARVLGSTLTGSLSSRATPEAI